MCVNGRDVSPFMTEIPTVSSARPSTTLARGILSSDRHYQEMLEDAT